MVNYLDIKKIHVLKGNCVKKDKQKNKRNKLERVFKMRKIDKKKLYEDITVYLGKKLERLNDDGWLDKELSEKTGIVQTRFTELKNFEKYGRPVTEKHLAILIGEGIIMAEDIVKNVEMSDAGKAHILDMQFYKNPKARKVWHELESLGIDPYDALMGIVRKAKAQKEKEEE